MECGLPTDLDAVRERVRTAPHAAFYGVPPRRGRVRDCLKNRPAQWISRCIPLSATSGTTIATRTASPRTSWPSWVVTDVDAAALGAKLNSTAALVSAGFGWDVLEPAGGVR